MGAAKKKFSDYKSEKQEVRRTQPDPLGDMLGMVRAFVETCVDEHPSDPPPVITMGLYQGSTYVTVSDKAYRRSVSGWGMTYSEALGKLEEILMRNELPWKAWA